MTREAFPERKLFPVLARLFRVGDESISAETSRGETPTWDSLTHLQMIMAVEEAFGVHFTTLEATSIESVADVVALLERKGGTDA